MPVTVFNPEGLAKPHGYSHAAVGRGRLLAIAGQIGWDAAGRIVSDDFTAQFDQALGNVAAVLGAMGGIAEDVLSLRIYVTDRKEYLTATREIGVAYRKHLGRHYPAMALVQVAALLEIGAKVEIEAMAVLPDGAAA